eukprot:COSAG06_NODE_474_length_15284_cov_124.295582_8_plen_47_part_00
MITVSQIDRSSLGKQVRTASIIDPFIDSCMDWGRERKTPLYLVQSP